MKLIRIQIIEASNTLENVDETPLCQKLNREKL